MDFVLGCRRNGVASGIGLDIDIIDYVVYGLDNIWLLRPGNGGEVETANMHIVTTWMPVLE